MEPFAMALAVVSLFAAGIVKGATGIGYVSCALPFLVAAVGLQAAMSLVLVPALATNVVVALTAGHLREVARRLWPLYLAMLPGIAIGLALLVWIDQQIAVGCLGAAMVAYAAFAIARPQLTIPTHWQAPLVVPAGLLNGIVTGLTGSQVMPLLPYVMGLNLQPGLAVQAINIAVILSTLVVGLGLAGIGILTADVLALSCAAVVPAVLGAALGSYLRTLVPVESFRTLTLAVLAVMGIGMLVRL